MSFDTEIIAMYGICLNNEDEVENFLKQYEESEFFEKNYEVCCLNNFDGYPFVLGYKVKLGETFEKYIKMWNKNFPNSEKQPKGILEIQYSG